MEKQTTNKRIGIDFEYCAHRQKDFRVLCAVTQIEGEEPRVWWLDVRDESREPIRDKFREYCNAKRTGFTWLAYGATAESECFVALGLNPREFNWYDLHTDYRQIQNGSDTWNFGAGIFKRAEKLKTCCTEPVCDCVKKKYVSIGHRYERVIACPTKIVDVSRKPDLAGDYDTIDPGEYEVRWERLPRTNTNYPVMYIRHEYDATAAEKEYLQDKCEKELKAIIAGRGFTGENIKPNLVNATFCFAGVERSGTTKDETRDLILENKPFYSESEVFQIKDYAKDDVVYLFAISDKMEDVIGKQTGWTPDKIHRARLNRGRFAANTAFLVRRGLPVSRERLLNLRRNKNKLIGQFYSEFNTKYFPLYSYFKGGWHKRARDFNNVVRYLQSIGHVDKWKRTKKGDFSSATSDGSPVDKYSASEDRDGFAPLTDFRRIDRVTTSVGSIPEFNGIEFADEQVVDGVDSDTTFLSFLGDDYRLRPYFGIYGTQTARNAPKATGFLPAQASWLRALIEPPPGRCVVELDYSSQEFWIAAVLSGDPGLIRAYSKESFTKGDPYLAFAYDAGMVNDREVEVFLQYKNAEDEGIEIPEDVADIFKHAKTLRKLSKSTVLGLNYGMGIGKLAEKLRTDSRDWSITDDRAKELRELHKKAYPVYYDYKDKIADHYFAKNKPIVLRDGWYLAAGKPETLKLSVLNLPFQGCGSAIMRLMVDKLLDADVDVICPVHDSIIFECDEATLDETCKLVSDIMIEAAEEITGKTGIRVGGAEVVKAGEYWVTEKGAGDFKKYRWSLEELEPTPPPVVLGDGLDEPPLEKLPKSRIPKAV